jgi:hypothetical protein
MITIFLTHLEQVPKRETHRRCSFYQKNIVFGWKHFRVWEHWNPFYLESVDDLMKNMLLVVGWILKKLQIR